MSQEDILNQIASLRSLDEAVLRHLVLDMAVSAFSSPDGLAHQTMHLAKLAYNGMGAPRPQNGATHHPAIAAPTKRGRPPKNLQGALEEVLTDEGVGERIEHGDIPDGLLLTRAEAAARKGISLATLDRLARDGYLHRIKLPSTGRGAPRAGFRVAEVDAAPGLQRPPTKGKRSLGPQQKADDITAAEWRAEILDYSRQHGDVFRPEDYQAAYSLKFPNNVPLGKSRMRQVVFDMRNRLKILTNIGRGVYRVTAKGKAYKGGEDLRAVSNAQNGRVPKKTRGAPGSFAAWLTGYARQHRGVVIVKQLRKDFLAEHGKHITGGKLYDVLNDPKVFRKEGERGNIRFTLTGLAGSVAKKASVAGAAREKLANRAPAFLRREALHGLSEDILDFSQQHGGEIVMGEYREHFNEKFSGSGDATSRNGSIYGAISQLIQKGKLEKVASGVYRTASPRQETVSEAAAPPVTEEEESAAGAAIYE